MAIGVLFDKAKAKYFLECLCRGKCINRQHPSAWSHEDMLTLAGVCFCVAMSHGPAGHCDTDWSKVPGERCEAIAETLNDDIHTAIAWQGQLAMMIMNGEYDEHYECQCMAIAMMEDGKMWVIPVKGFRNFPEANGA
jgi:hypothetical protein